MESTCSSLWPNYCVPRREIDLFASWEREADARSWLALMGALYSTSVTNLPK
jgi:hypothetical protein